MYKYIYGIHAVYALEQHLVKTKKKTDVSIILESGEPRDVHQFATILGYGATAIYPYLAHECIEEMIQLNMLDKEVNIAIDDYNEAILKGIVKIAAKWVFRLFNRIKAPKSLRPLESLKMSSIPTSQTPLVKWKALL